MDLVAEAYRNGLHNYPQVQSYFVWSKETERIAPAEALFYGRGSIGERDTLQMSDGARFRRDPELGREIIEIARRRQYAQHIYVAEDVARIAERHYAVLGYVVAPATLPDMFAALHERRLGALLRQRGGDFPLELRVTDEQGRIVFGRLTKEPSASVPVSMEFYPAARIESRLVAGGLTPRLWRFEVSANVPDRGLLQAYWPTAASVMLMLVGFGLIVQANRRADELARRQADFIGYASHQLKTPLSLISAATETVEMAHGPARRRNCRNTSASFAARSRGCRRWCSASSSFSAAAARGYEFEQWTRRRSCARPSRRSQQPRAQQFTFVVDRTAPRRRLDADPAAIEQALANLLDNAVKYSGESRESVRVGWTTGGDAASTSSIAASGLTAPRIVARSSTSSTADPLAGDREGSGSACPSAGSWCRLTRPRRSVTAAPGAGSTFRVILPVIRLDRIDPASMRVDEPTHGRSLMNRSVTAAIGRCPSAHVLVIEDEAQMRDDAGGQPRIRRLPGHQRQLGRGCAARVRQRDVRCAPRRAAAGHQRFRAVRAASRPRRAIANHHPDGPHPGAGPHRRPRGRRRRLRQQAVQRPGTAGAGPRPGAARRLASATGEEFSFGDVTLRSRQRLVTRRGRRVALSAREFELLRYLLAHRNEVVSREQLLRDVWGYHRLP